MGRLYGSRTLVAICGALAILLAALAILQYRWSTRVAAADAQREKEHLDSAASLFANEFNNTLQRAVEFMQSDARSALASGDPLLNVPRLISELYWLDHSQQGPAAVERLGSDGRFSAVAPPDWMPVPRCSEIVLDHPPALAAPIYQTSSAQQSTGTGNRVIQTFRLRPDRCFVARLDQAYLRDSLLPLLIRQAFGETAAKEYDFAVVSRTRPHETIYGRAVQPDLQKPFFSVLPLPLPLSKPLASGPPQHQALFVQRIQTTVDARTGPGGVDIFGLGVWQLNVAHKGMPLEAAFERTRRQNLLMSIGVETLLLAAILFLIVAARRTQKLADQKMQFVAGVSHELRTPVSAIAMLARNQADGLVAGADKVKQYGELMHQQARRLNEMIEQTLQYAGIHSGLRRPAKSEIDLRHLIQQAVEERREEFTRRDFEVETDLSPDLPPVKGDATLLRTAFDNLLNNAQQYADGGRWIRVSARYSEPQREILISVEDRGAGIDPQDQADIFEPFCRGRAAVEAQIPGSGLGLSLVRSAAEAHRGSVTLVSEPGRGSTFTMHLPV